MSGVVSLYDIYQQGFPMSNAPQKNNGRWINLAFIASVLAAVMAYFFSPVINGNSVADSPNDAAQLTPPEPRTCHMAAQDTAEALIKRLLPAAKILSAEPFPLDAEKTTCLLEVEMLADAENDNTRGFVYVLPDGKHFLNGPLMDKRSRIGLTPEEDKVLGDLKAEQAAVTEKLLSMVNQNARAAEAADTQPPAKPKSNEPDYYNQIQGAFADIQSTDQLPTPAELRKHLKDKMATLPSLTQGTGSKAVYVMLDPQCIQCKKLHAQYAELSKQHDIQFHWIPVFLNETSWGLSALLLKTQQESPEKAVALLDKIMATGKAIADPEIANGLQQLTESDYAAVKPSTGILYEIAKANPKFGTPMVVFARKDGDTEVLGGLPVAEDWLSL